MFIQIVFGSLLIIVTIMIAGASYLVMEALFVRYHAWLVRRPHAPKQMLVLCVTALWILALVTISVWIWAIAFRVLGIFSTFEAALYFALVSFTTLGFGDVLLPQDWRLLSGLIAANGLMNFGLSTAIMIEVMRQLRINQLDAVRED